MLIQAVAKLDLVEIFLYWIAEREYIRKRRAWGATKPWTDDTILQSFRFCNVRRMDDAVSDWLLTNWYKPNFNHNNSLIACTLARFFNLPSSLELIGYPVTWDADRIRRLLRGHAKRGNNIFNAAYMVRGNDGVDKVASVINHTILPLVKDPPNLDPTSMANCWGVLSHRYGFGSFMAGQVVADLRWAKKGTWADKMSWAPVGPGSSRGMCRLLGDPPRPSMDQDEFIDCLRLIVPECIKQLSASITSRLEMHDWQNCLCEFDKYCRVLFGEGRPKRNYNGVG